MMDKKFKRKIKMEMEHFEQDNRLKIKNQIFVDEITLNQYVKWGALAKIIFVDCHFEELDLLGKIINSCDFKNCIINNVSFRKCQFSSSRFESCQIKNSDFTRAEFDYCTFTKSQFVKSDLRGSCLMDCEFIEPKFIKSRLNPIILMDIKLLKSNKWNNIKSSFDFKKILKNLGCIEE